MFLGQQFETPCTNRLNKRLSAFGRAKDGNIAIMFAFMIGVLMLFTGGAVDYTRYNTIRADIVESLDAAALAMARYNELGGPLIDDLEEGSEERADALEEFAEALFYENFAHENAVPDLEVNFDLDYDLQEISASATGNLKTLLLQVGRRFTNPGAPSTETSKIDLDVEVVIQLKGTGRIELALVLDVTGSMSRNTEGSYSAPTKMDDLKTAVDTMLTVLYGEETESEGIKIGVVPFNAFVNPGGTTEWTDSWSDENADADYHGARFFHVGEDGVPDMDTKVNHFNLYDSIPDYEWQGCVEARPYPLDEMDTVPGETANVTEINNYDQAPSSNTNARISDAFDRAPALTMSASAIAASRNSRFVPMFWPDEPDCNTHWNGRCPWPNGYSWWNVSDTITVNGSSETINFARYWFVDPDFYGYEDGDYGNAHFIDDQQYVGRNEGEDVARYAYIVRQFRGLGEGSLSAAEQDWKDFLEDLGAEHYYDDEIDEDGSAYWNDYRNHEYDYTRYYNSNGEYDEFIMRNAYVGWWDSSSETYDYKYDLTNNLSGGYGPEQGCPTALLPLTTSREDVETYVEDLEPGGFTNTAVGTMWGWRILSRDAPFTEGALYNDTEWAKAVVIMTDGFNDAGSDEDTPWGSSMTTYGFASEERMGEGVNYASYYNSSWNSNEMRDHMDEKMLRICARMKEKGILVYSIVFGLEDETTEEVFQACATDTIAPYYHKAPDGDDLEDAFGEIASDLVNLHISQ